MITNNVANTALNKKSWVLKSNLRTSIEWDQFFKPPILQHDFFPFWNSNWHVFIMRFNFCATSAIGNSLAIIERCGQTFFVLDFEEGAFFIYFCLKREDFSLKNGYFSKSYCSRICWGFSSSFFIFWSVRILKCLLEISEGFLIHTEKRTEAVWKLVSNG